MRAVVLTHAHFDHVGSAKRARGRWQVPVFVHAADQYPAGALFVLPGHGEPWHHGIASAAEAALRAGPS
ncbi:hypothetical protein AWC24_20045 [Mycolicibacter senuensis]|nr:hypothetical protein AWC24_20045 [Mycolicibacter senuensis]